jgi:hypothetical protein
MVNGRRRRPGSIDLWFGNWRQVSQQERYLRPRMLMGFGMSYADQAEKGQAESMKAVRSGRIEVQVEH